jgi:hypothetical protein
MAKEINNNTYLNYYIKETEAFIIKHIISKLPRQRRRCGETRPYKLGGPFRVSNKPPFVDYSPTSLKAHYQKLIVKWEK